MFVLFVVFLRVGVDWLLFLVVLSFFWVGFLNIVFVIVVFLRVVWCFPGGGGSLCPFLWMGIPR